jgi:hypothetical protein
MMPIPQPSSAPKAASNSAINPACCHACFLDTSRLVTIDRTLAAVNKMPTAASARAALPALFPGTRPNSETASALMNATSAEAARTWWMTAGWPALPSRGETEIATNSSPIRPAAQVASAVRNSR